MAYQQSAAKQDAKKAMEAAVSMIDSVIEETEKKEKEVVAGFGTKDGFELLLREAKWLSQTDIVPKRYQNNIGNCAIALEMANRLGASPISVMQSLFVVHGNPGWSAQFVISAVNSTGKFSPIRFDISPPGKPEKVSCQVTYYEGKDKRTRTVVEEICDRTCTAWAIEKKTGEKLYGPPISMKMAVLEGWVSKDGSKWKTMPDVMLRYRAAAFFGRIYAPEVLNGMKTVEEIEDIGIEDRPRIPPQAEISANANRQEIDIEPYRPESEKAPEPAEGLTEEEKAAIVAEEIAAAEAEQGQPESAGPGF
jgi:hypothetical protein